MEEQKKNVGGRPRLGKDVRSRVTINLDPGVLGRLTEKAQAAGASISQTAEAAIKKGLGR